MTTKSPSTVLKQIHPTDLFNPNVGVVGLATIVRGDVDEFGVTHVAMPNQSRNGRSTKLRKTDARGRGYLNNSSDVKNS